MNSYDKSMFFFWGMAFLTFLVFSCLIVSCVKNSDSVRGKLLEECLKIHPPLECESALGHISS